MKLNTLLVERLAALGVQRPSPALIEALEAHLTPRISALVERSVTKTLVARAFASTLVEANQGSPEGMRASASLLASNPEASSCAQQDKTPGVAGAGENGEAS